MHIQASRQSSHSAHVGTSTHLDQVNLPIIQLPFPVARRGLPEVLEHRTTGTALRIRAGGASLGCALELLQEVTESLLELLRRERMRVLLLWFYEYDISVCGGTRFQLAPRRPEEAGKEHDRALEGHCRLPRKRMRGWRVWLARRSEGCIVEVDGRDVQVRRSADSGYSLLPAPVLVHSWLLGRKSLVGIPH